MQILSSAACRIDNWKCAQLLGLHVLNVLLCIYHQLWMFIDTDSKRNVFNYINVTRCSRALLEFEIFFFAFFIILSLLFCSVFLSHFQPMWTISKSHYGGPFISHRRAMNLSFFKKIHGRNGDNWNFLVSKIPDNFTILMFK